MQRTVGSASPDEIEEFLHGLRQIVGSNPRAISISRRPGLDETLSWLGITRRDVPGVLTGLTVKDYHSGPMPDDQARASTIWVFLPTVQREQVYLKIADWRPSAPPFVVVSFHPPAWPHRPR